MELAFEYLRRYKQPLEAYVRFQAALMRRFEARGGTQEEFVQRLAPVYARRFRWMYQERANHTQRGTSA